MVMRAAQDTAKKKRTVFRGLELLSAATYVPSPLTPTARPESDAAKTRDSSAQVPEPAPTTGGRRPASGAPSGP